MPRSLARASLVLAVLGLSFAPDLGSAWSRGGEVGVEASRDLQRTAQARRRQARRRRARPIVNARYRRMVRDWHAKAPRALVRAWKREPLRRVELRRVGLGGRFEIAPTDGVAAWDPATLETAREAFRSRHDSQTCDAVHPRLLELVYRAALHFDAPWVYVVSGYRTTRETSRHSQGRAIDMVLPGIPDRRLASWARKQGFVGVGLYTVSGFVHVDVRSRSYFWVDSTRPGQAPRSRPILRELVSRMDREARSRGEQAVPDLEVAEEESADAALAPGEEVGGG